MLLNNNNFMALNIETFKTRALTALIFVVVMMGGLLWNKTGFIALFTLIHFGCWFEFIKLLRKIKGSKFFIYAFAGLIYISLPMLMMIDLRTSFLNSGCKAVFPEGSIVFPCAILFSIWINDTMAYIVGSFIGKTPFSSISPKKTWEGTVGGAVLCVVTITLLGYFIPLTKAIDFKHWMAIAAICAVFGTAGDLLESKLKRMADVKDSGSFMPGHGGFLDRFDSLLVATPFVWLYICLFV